jgi:hypothetical protein
MFENYVYCQNHDFAGFSKIKTSLDVFGNETLIAYFEEYLENLNERVLIG